MSFKNTKLSAPIKKYQKPPGLPSLRRMLGMLLLFAAVGLSSCESLFVSLASANETVSFVSTTDR